MIPVEMKDLVSALLERARENRVNWVSAADLALGSDNDDVVVSFPDYSVNVFKGDPDDGPAFIAFNILNSVGKAISGFRLIPDDPDYGVLEELLRRALVKVMGVEEAIDTLSRALMQSGTIGLPRTKPRNRNDLPF